MTKFKTKKLFYTASLILFGVLYFTTFSSLEIHPLLRNQIALIPVQIGVLIYFLYWKQKSIYKGDR